MARVTETPDGVRTLTIKEAVQASGIPKSTLMRMIYAGDIDYIQKRRNTRIRIDPAALERWKRDNTRNAQQPGRRQSKTPAA
jgi:excisionase family DNA binding protein